MKDKCGSCRFVKECNPVLKKWGYYCSSNVAEKAGQFINKNDGGCRQFQSRGK